jgi:hypothetical protein
MLRNEYTTFLHIQELCGDHHGGAAVARRVLPQLEEEYGVVSG